jgi:hypothetical protein
MADKPKTPSDHEVISMPARGGAVEPPPPPRPDPASSLTPGQWTALGHLAIKQAGGDVPWINIADARALTDAGMAERNREGWNITQAGTAELAAQKLRDAT